MAGAYSSTTGKKRKRTVNLAKLADPQMVTLTGLPANRAGFKVIRSAAGALENVPESTEEDEMLDFQKRTRARGTTAKKAAAPEVTTIKRVDTGLLTLILPEGATEDDAANVIEQFGLTDDYTIVRDDDNRISLVRKEEEGAEAPMGSEVALANGLNAIVDTSMFRSDKAIADTDTYPLAVARIDFNIAHGFETLENVRDYLTDNEIDYLKDGVEQVEGGVIVHRAAEYDGKGVKIEIAPGITAHIVRGETESIPRAIRRAVTDAAFGSFGMGHLDFSAALVDPEFSNQASNAIWQVSDVFDNIVFRSGLPLDERKTLITRAAEDFVGFMTGLMTAVGDMGFASVDRSERFKDLETDSGAKAVIPEGAVEDNDTSEEVKDVDRKDAADEDSGKDTATQEATARSDTEDTSEATVSDESEDSDGGGSSNAPAVEAVSRKDIQDTVKVALEAAGETFGAALKGVTESIEKMTKRLDDSDKARTALEEKIEELGDETTVARSDDDDGGSADVPDEGGQVADDTKPEEVFRGAFGKGFHPRKSAARS